MSTPPGPVSLPLIDIRALRFRYPGASSDALDGVDLCVQEGEFVVVVGANGSGKSTLARLLGGLEKADGADVAAACGHDLLREDGRIGARRDIGVLFQNPENQLVAQCVEEDIAFGLENLAWPAAEMRRRVEEMLDRFGLAELRRRPPHLLSGGQKQRVALAGVIAVPRTVLILDEPTAMLDPVGRLEVMQAVLELHEEGLAVVLITQEMEEVVGADRVVALEAGRNVYDGRPDDFFADSCRIERLRLSLPPAGELALALSHRGMHARRLPLNLEELLRELARRS